MLKIILINWITDEVTYSLSSKATYKTALLRVNGDFMINVCGTLRKVS